jgi:hypothetical protein
MFLLSVAASAAVRRPGAYPDRMAGDEEHVDPKEFLRALLHISPEDAEKARQDSPANRKPEGQEGPYHDYGDDPPKD